MTTQTIVKTLTDLDQEIAKFFAPVIGSANPNVTRHNFEIDQEARTISFNCAGYTKSYRDTEHGKGTYKHSHVYQNLIQTYKNIKDAIGSTTEASDKLAEEAFYPFGRADSNYNISLNHDPANAYDPYTERLFISSEENASLRHLHNYCIGYVPACASEFIHKYRQHFNNIKIQKFCTNLPGARQAKNSNARLSIFYGHSEVLGINRKDFKRFHDILEG